MMKLHQKVAVDLGTANTLVYVAGSGIVLNEPTVVAYSLQDKRIVSIGQEAKEMLGRTPGSIVAVHPLKDGVIADYTMTQALIAYFLKKALKSFTLRLQLMITVPGGATQVEKRAVVAACRQAGASEVYLMSEPVAAAVGAKVPISQPSGNMIINLGGGTTEIAVISLGQLVVYKSVRTAGRKIDEAIMQHLKKNSNLIIGERTAEDIKMKIGVAYLSEEKSSLDTHTPPTLEIKGRDFQSGLPKIIEVAQEVIMEAIQKPLKTILEGVKEVLHETPPELSADIIDRGIVLTGGTALLSGIDRYFTYKVNVVSFVAEDPLLCVVRGIGMAIENLESYKEAIK